MYYVFYGVFFQKLPEVIMNSLDTALMAGNPEFDPREATGLWFSGFVKHGLTVPLVGPVGFGDPSGFMMDAFGISALYYWSAGSYTIRFQKEYDQNEGSEFRATGLIHYELARQSDDLWVGSYTGEDAGTGPVRCKILKVNESFVVPPPLPHEFGVI